MKGKVADTGNKSRRGYLSEEGLPLASNKGARSPVIELVCVSKTFPASKHAAVDGLSLAVEARELVAILGPSGCGKTTTLRLIAGFEQPDAGRIAIAGRPVADPDTGLWVPPERRNVGMVFQDYALFPHYSVAGNIAFGLKGWPKVERERRVAELLALVGLEGLGKRHPHQLSGGQQQRVALARALAPKPTVVLLDEPFSNLDLQMRAETRREVRRILHEAGATAILVTHDQAEALEMADRVAVMRAGRLEQVDRPVQLYQKPASAFTAEFLGVTSRLEGFQQNGCVMIGETSFPHSAKEAGPVVVMVRDNEARLAPAGQAVEDDEVAFPCQVEDVVFVGSHYHYLVQIAGQVVIVDADAPVDAEEVAVVVPLSCLRIYPDNPG
ncbi:MAG: ABC transporter ATP-binding protein [Chloroflexi bacterium]|nr:ABC transporter ATP-binding protein [Chloroflexota bacterium]